MSLTFPASWVEVTEDLREEVLAVFSDDRTLSPAVATNAVVIGQELPPDFELRTWQSEARARQLASLPDLQVLEDRALDGESLPTWYRSSVMTDQGGTTVLTRQWSRLVDQRGLTLTLTTLPMVDALHADLLDAIAESWTLEEEIAS